MSSVDTALALLALIVSLVALALALRGRRAPDPTPPAPPPPPPPEDGEARARLDSLEARREGLATDLRALADRVIALEAGWGEEAEALREGFASMELAFTTLREATPDPVTDVEEEPAPESPPLLPEEQAPEEQAPEEQVREHLRDEGWSDVVLLPDGESRYRVEARRDGGLAKGCARLFPDGRVEARLARPTRAFP